MSWGKVKVIQLKILLSKKITKVSIGEVGCDDHYRSASGAHPQEREDIRVAEVSKDLRFCQEVTLILFSTFVCEEGERWTDGWMDGWMDGCMGE